MGDDMSKTNDLELNWEQLERESLTRLPGDFQVSENVEVGSAVPLRDRLSELYLNGFFPILTILACAFLVASYHSVSVALIGVGVLAPLVAWLVRPFLLNRGTITVSRLAIWTIPLLLLASLKSRLYHLQTSPGSTSQTKTLFHETTHAG